MQLHWKAFWGFYSLLQAEEIWGHNSSEDTAHKYLGFTSRKNAIAEEDSCLPASLGQVHKVIKLLTLTFAENVVRIQKSEYTSKNGACSAANLREMFPSVLKSTKDHDLISLRGCVGDHQTLF